MSALRLARRVLVGLAVFPLVWLGLALLIVIEVVADALSDDDAEDRS